MFLLSILQRHNTNKNLYTEHGIDNFYAKTFFFFTNLYIVTIDLLSKTLYDISKGGYFVQKRMFLSILIQ